MRALWAAVVLQAKDDLDQQPYNSVIWSQAFAFFTAAGDWAASRQNIADCLDLHTDDLVSLGRAACRARIERDGGPPAPEPPVIRVATPPDAPEKDPAPIRIRATRPAKDKRDRNWWITRFLAQQMA